MKVGHRQALIRKTPARDRVGVFLRLLLSRPAARAGLCVCRASPALASQTDRIHPVAHTRGYAAVKRAISLVAIKYQPLRTYSRLQLAITTAYLAQEGKVMIHSNVQGVLAVFLNWWGMVAGMRKLSPVLMMNFSFSSHSIISPSST